MAPPVPSTKRRVARPNPNLDLGCSFAFSEDWELGDYHDDNGIQKVTSLKLVWKSYEIE